MTKTFISQYVVPLVVGGAITLTGCQPLTDTHPATSHDGLELVSSKPLDAVYRKPGADLKAYQRVMISDCSVAFRKNWQRDQNSTNRDIVRRVTDKDMNNIRDNLGKLCQEVFVEELTKDKGYQIADAPADDVLELRPGIIDLDIHAPDTMSPGRSRSYTTSAGSMELYLEAFDSVSGEILGRVIDRRRATDTGNLEWTNAVTNQREAKRILRRWGQVLRDMLDNAG